MKFADPTNRKYPIDSPGHIKAAWAYVHQPENAAKYKSEEVRTIKNVAALERLFIEWSKTGGRIPSWEFLTAHGCLVVDTLTEEQLGQFGVTREALRRLAAGDAELPPTKPASWNAPTEEQTPPPKIL